jgi:hypothetical protein
MSNGRREIVWPFETHWFWLAPVCGELTSRTRQHWRVLHRTSGGPASGVQSVHGRASMTNTELRGSPNIRDSRLPSVRR